MRLRALARAAVLVFVAAARIYGAEPSSPLPAAGTPIQAAPGESLRPLRSVPCEAGEDWGYLTRRSPEDGLAIPLPWDDARFMKFREAYLSQGGRKWLETVISRSSPYACFVAERIRWYGLPEELFFLPTMESEWSPRAVSRSGAAGLWQFMRNSIAGYDMRVTEWLDERRDFMKSTDAALRKLRDNYDALGSWEMALAAYNCGLGAAARASARGGTRDFWKLSAQGLLPPQTVSYVPKFLAIASLMNRGARNGFPIPAEPALQWETIDLDRPVDLTLLAKASGVSLSDLRSGNSELRYDITPPEGSYSLKVPVGFVRPVREVLEDKDFKAMRFYLYKIRSGDTLSALARHYEVSVSLIERFNPGLKPDRLRIGSTIVVPALKDIQPYSSEPSPGETMDFSGSYTVAKGDTLWSISLRYSIQPETLAERNGLDISSIIREGMSLKVPRME